MVLVILTAILPIIYTICIIRLFKYSRQKKMNPLSENLCTLSQSISKEHFIQIPLLISVPVVVGLMFFYLTSIKAFILLYALSIVLWFGVGLGFFLLGVSVSLNGTRYHRMSGNILVFFFFSATYTFFFTHLLISATFAVFGIISTTLFVILFIAILIKNKFIVKSDVQIYLLSGMCTFLLICFLYGFV